MKREPSLVPIVEGQDIIFPTEAHEHDRCKVLEFEGYKKTLVRMKETSSGNGHKGFTVLIKETWGRFIKVEKEDTNKQYIWLKII